MKPNTIHNPQYEKVLKETSLQIRLKVINEMMFIKLLTELGFRQDKMWTEDEEDMLTKLCYLAENATELQMEEIKEWEKDGKPK